jgi:hypothetical protein
MSIATNLLIMILGINLMLFVFGNPEVNSPMLAILKGIFTGNIDWSYLIYTIGKNAWIFLALIGVITTVSYLTGANPLTGGGGYGSILTLQIIGLAIASSLFLMPNFSTFGFPAMIEYILNIIFGGFITVTVISLLRGY